MIQIKPTAGLLVKHKRKLPLYELYTCRELGKVILGAQTKSGSFSSIEMQPLDAAKLGLALLLSALLTGGEHFTEAISRPTMIIPIDGLFNLMGRNPSGDDPGWKPQDVTDTEIERLVQVALNNVLRVLEGTGVDAYFDGKLEVFRVKNVRD